MYDPKKETLARYRERVIQAYTSSKPAAHEERIISGPSGSPGVRVLLYRPSGVSTTTPGVLSIHGGGYISGTADMVGATCRALADEHKVLVVNVDYRLAPEVPFPGPLEDCYAALDWLFSNCDEQGVDPSRIVVMGGSAGGGLAAALALLARDRGRHAIRAQVLNYPMLDPRTGTPEAPIDNPLTGEFVWTRETN